MRMRQRQDLGKASGAKVAGLAGKWSILIGRQVTFGVASRKPLGLPADQPHGFAITRNHKP